VIGINPYDKKEDGIGDFMDKRGVNYTVLLEGKEVAKAYRVSGYPTMFLIDKEGNIVFIQQGYGKSVDKQLKKVIKKHL
jgi:thioredoxin-related protein